MGFQTADFRGDRRAERPEFLPDGHGHGIAQLRAADLQDRTKGFRLFIQRRVQPPKGIKQRVNRQQQPQAKRRRIDIIGGLRHVDMVIGVQHGIGARLFPQQAKGHIRDDLIGVHVCRCARPALHGVHNKLRAAGRVFQYPPACALNGVSAGAVQVTQCQVGPCRRLLDRHQSLHQFPERADCRATYRKIIQRAFRMHTPQGAGGNGDLTQQVALDALTGHCRLRPHGPGRGRGGAGCGVWCRRGHIHHSGLCWLKYYFKTTEQTFPGAAFIYKTSPETSLLLRDASRPDFSGRAIPDRRPR